MARAGPLLRSGASWTPAAPDLAHAAARLAVLSRREAAGAFAGGYRSAFRGGGSEFEESRPYVPGDDPRAIDWNAFARSGALHVKRMREERDQTLWLAVDVSASMAFGGAGPSKAALAARSAALLASAACEAGDRVGLVCFDQRLRSEVAPGRGEAHRVALLRALVAAGRPGEAVTALAPALAALQERIPKRSVVCLLSDFRDEALLGAGELAGRLRATLAALARRHDLVAMHVRDPLEATLPRVGRLRLADPEAPGASWLVDTGRKSVRERYALAARLREQRLERRLRAEGADWLALATDADPLRALARFFARRAALGGRARSVRR